MNRANGFITLSRKILDWEWVDDDAVFSCFVKLLLAVNHKDSKWHNIVIKRGSIVGSTETLCDGLRMKRTTFKRCRKILQECGAIEVYVQKNQYQMITVVNYDKYQSLCSVGRKTTHKPTNRKTGKKTDRATTIEQGAVKKRSSNLHSP